MIFVTVGTHNDGFDRLVEAADRYAATSKQRVVIQRGTSRYGPEHAESFKYAPGNEIEALSRSADVIVTHAGAGSLLTSLAACTDVIAVPRLRQHGEHLDDHQLELASALHKAGRLRMVLDLAELPVALDRASPQEAVSASCDEVPLLPYIQRRLAELAETRGHG